MAVALLCHPFHNHHSSPYPSLRSYRPTLQRPPSPPMEESKPSKYSLPSISTLIQVAGGAEDGAPDRQAKESAPSSAYADAHSPSQNQERAGFSTAPRVMLPPTPPLRPGSTFGSMNQSPTSHAPLSSIPTSNSNYYNNNRSTNTSDPHPPRHMTYPPIQQNRHTLSSQLNQPSHDPNSHTNSPYGSPTAASIGSYHASPIEGPPYSTLAYQRPLPGNFPPPIPFGQPPPPPQLPQMISSANPTWQHHHYFPPSASAPYAANQERYICPTCSKPFSRPSSLKIHTYSHTGEKPYKCKHDGCGKYFSVRSNMKRHEKGCHGDGGSVREESPAESV